MSSEETEAASPPWGSHPHGVKGLWALGGLTVSTVAGHRTGHKPYAKRWVEAVVKPREDGAYVHQHLNFIPFGKVHGRKAKASNRTWEIRPSGIIGGCVRKTRNRHAVRKMEVGPPEPPCGRRLQTAVSCFSQKLRW